MSSIVSPDPWSQLMMLSQMTKLTGALHEAQILQLRYWPLVAAPHAESSKTEIDVEKKEIDFTLILSKEPPPDDFNNRLKGLSRSVKDMLGQDWLIRVIVEGKVIFSGRRNIQNTTTNSPDTGRKTSKSKRKRTSGV